MPEGEEITGGKASEASPSSSKQLTLNLGYKTVYNNQKKKKKVERGRKAEEMDAIRLRIVKGIDSLLKSKH